jgi:hypothetical protein
VHSYVRAILGRNEGRHRSAGFHGALAAAGRWDAPGTHNIEKRRLTMEDVKRRFRRSGGVSDP